VECGHATCTCAVPEGEYCSDHCREHAGHPGGDAEHDCACGHPECRGTQAGAGTAV
jgi:hypothetical protein